MDAPNPARREETDSALLEALLAHAPAGIALVDRDVRFVRVNEAMATFCGHSPDALAGKRIADCVPELWPVLRPLYERVFAGETVIGQEVSATLPPRSAPIRHWLISLYPVRPGGGPAMAVVILNEITERRQAEAALRIRTDLYAMLSRTNLAVGQCRSREELFREICTIAVETGRFRCCWIGVPERGELRMVAAAGDDGGYLDGLVIPLDESDPRSQGPTGRSLRTGWWVVVNDFKVSPLTIPWRDKARRAGIEASAAFPLLERGKVAAVLTLYAHSANFFTEELVTALNVITPSISNALEGFLREEERRRDEAELRLLDRAIGSVSQGILITDASLPDNPIIFVSPSFEQLTGYSLEEVIGQNCRFLQGSNTDLAALAELRDAIREGLACQVELLNYRKDGTPFWNNLALSPVRNEDGVLTHFVGVQTDVTERRHLEAQFRQAQKMEAIGLLAGGIAHDFNNLLTVINGCSEILLADRTPADPAHEDLTAIHLAGQRAGALTRQLLAFSRDEVPERRLVSLNEIVGNTQKMLQRLIGEDVILTTRLDPGLRQVNADPGQVEQILFNLALNARDAMPRGGSLTIETSNVALAMRDVSALGNLEPGEYVLLAISDTGTGMDEATRARIFEPFFTTKVAGKGTGLGLSTVYGIVGQSRGHIAVDSVPHQGSRFRIYLPAASGVRAAPEVTARAQDVPRGTETVLLVEDDEPVRTVARHMLASFGYNVLEAADGQEAVRLAENHPGPIHLLVSDVVMPHLSGQEIAQRITQSRSGCRVLFVSGYTDDAMIRHGVQTGDYAFLRKPFTRAELGHKVRSVLDGGREGGG